MAFNRQDIVKLIAVALTFLGGSSTPMLAESDPSLLKGKVQASDHVVRLQRPKMPQLSAESPTADPSRMKAVVRANDFNFSLKAEKDSPGAGSGITYSAEPPQQDPAAAKQEPLASDTEDADLLIAWEEWHKRVCEAIYQNWLRNSKIPGIAHTTLSVTRDHHITVEVRDVQLGEAVMSRIPRAGADFQVDQIRDEFTREIQATIAPLDGNSLLEFPAGSRRRVTSFHPYFSKDGALDGYEWRKDDYERVHLR